MRKQRRWGRDGIRRQNRWKEWGENGVRGECIWERWDRENRQRMGEGWDVNEIRGQRR